ncbi:MAG: TIGR02099 family protein [Gammaproteobacteria bacterium]|nr:TIGR02099 family protein [Gammaproteobacteria bacterium]MBU0787299.1 TIGR02099 family protein [Gammaproteobacteria bacterium]MBU0816039.1 TIGR02099 family protein [Gammaproteobacteria bacterium]MBU1787578.1 TIGR02099 family protein [Gammaproteobacteria bacterium]
MNDSQPTRSPLMRAASVTVRWALWLMVFIGFSLVVAWGVLHLLIVPRIGELRPQIENRATQVLGIPVRIESITARSVGIIPSFELTGVALFDTEGREVLRLPRVLASLSPGSLWNLGFQQLFIDQPVLSIRRTANGKIYVAGLDVSSNQQDDNSMAEWLFSQAEFAIHNGTIEWTDDMRGVPTLTLQQVDFVLRNGLRQHSARLDATPPSEWGDRFSLMAKLREPLWSIHHGNWRDWEGQLYADFERVDVSALRRHAQLGVDVSQGNGALRAWVDVIRGRVVGATADVALAEVGVKLGAKLQPLELQSVAGRLGGRLLSAGFEFSTEGLQFYTRDGMRWPGGNVRVSYFDAQGRAPARGELTADKLDLAALAQIANRMPLGDDLHATLLNYAPKGLVERIQASWQGPFSTLEKFEAKGRVIQLEVASRPGKNQGTRPSTQESPGTPGIRGASVDFQLTQTGGRATIALERGAIDLPGVFEESELVFDQLTTDTQWQIEGQRISVQLPNLKFSNADAQGEAQIKWHTSDPAVSGARSRWPGVLDVQGSLSRANGARVYRYLPLVLDQNVRTYVHQAVLKGQASGVKFKIKGDLHDMPFADARQGEFRVTAKVSDATYAYVPRYLQAANDLPWPPLTQVSGELVFDRASLQIKGARATVGGASGLQVTGAEAQIQDLGKTVVKVQLQARGPLADVLGVVNGSPLAAMTDRVLGRASAAGQADYSLRLNLPLAALDKSSVQGSVTLANNEVQITPDSPRLSRARGVISFSEKGFSIAAGQARMLGGDVRIEGGSVATQATTAPGRLPPASVVLRAQGSLSAEGLQQARELGPMVQLAARASGSTQYSAVLGFRRGVPELLISSNLQGLALALPEPLNKSASTLLPVRYESALVRDASSSAGGGPGRLLDQVQLDIGRLLSAQYVRDVSGSEPHVLRGAMGVGLPLGEQVPMPAEGVTANIQVGRLDLDAWMAVLPSSPTPVSTRADGRGAMEYLPTRMAIRAQELTVAGRKLNKIVVGGSREGLTWRANLDATELNGYLEYRQSAGDEAGRLHARLARLTLAPSSATEVEALLGQQPASIPALDIVVDDLELRGKKMGRVEIEAVNRGAGSVVREAGVREWRLNKLNVLTPEAMFTATGNWTAINAQSGATKPSGSEKRRTVMNFKLEINDAGELLTRYGMKEVVRRGKGRMEGRVAWVGSPLSLDYPSLSGAFNVNVENGQFLKADPGIAKLLGVLSLQALPRRLTLDFRDVFSEGFSFDFFRGDVLIEQGIARTNNLQMKGVNAAVLMEGRADIAKETQDIKVVVVPEINAGTASLIASVINPAVGLGSFLAQIFLRKPLIQSATQEFSITGPWADPKITKVEHNPASKTDNAGAQPDAQRETRP